MMSWILGLVYADSMYVIKSDWLAVVKKLIMRSVKIKVWGGTASWQAIQMIQNILAKLKNCWIDQNILLQLKIPQSVRIFSASTPDHKVSFPF